jgi:hypothetical protein
VASFEDISDKVASRLPLFIAVVIGLSVLLLVVVFRSLWIPLVSALFNLLSVAAAYGVVVAVFQLGVGADLIGAGSDVPMIAFLPVMLFAILFGLSMDYNVFLLSRIHEAYNQGDGPRESVIHGVGRIGKVVVFAGLIMAAVFLSFVTGSDLIGKMFGLGLGLAVLIDVLVVRMVIVPAAVTLLGDHAWWLPGWLDRVLPNVSLEGPPEPHVERATLDRGGILARTAAHHHSAILSVLVEGAGETVMLAAETRICRALRPGDALARTADDRFAVMLDSIENDQLVPVNARGAIAMPAHGTDVSALLEASEAALVTGTADGRALLVGIA